jgi:hypothetical protein
VSNSAPRQTKNEKRDHAREQARVMREQQKKKDRRRRFFIQGGIGVAIIAIIAIIADGDDECVAALARNTSG